REKHSCHNQGVEVKGLRAMELRCREPLKRLFDDSVVRKIWLSKTNTDKPRQDHGKERHPVQWCKQSPQHTTPTFHSVKYPQNEDRNNEPHRSLHQSRKTCRGRSGQIPKPAGTALCFLCSVAGKNRGGHEKSQRGVENHGARIHEIKRRRRQ